jgi:PAS domain S-box-containing protein
MDSDSLQRQPPGKSDEELGLLYQLGIALASGKDLFTTLATLQTEILKLIRAEAMFIAIYNQETDIVEYPIYFEVGEPEIEPASRRLSENPGLTGAVIHSRKTLYLPDMRATDVIGKYAPVDDDQSVILHTFLGIPLIVNQNVIGVLSVQSNLLDAYTSAQIRLMENVAVQAALAIDKSRLLDQRKQELDERARVEIDLRQRESILEAATFAAEEFLKTSDWRLNIDNVLERLGKTMHVTHAYLFEDHINAQGEPVTSMRYEWAAPGYPSDLGGPYFQESKIDTQGYEEQVDALRRGEVRVGNSSTFNPIEIEAMDEFGVKAILEVPIFVNGKEWGAIGFDDYEQERQWTSAEIDALKIAAGVLSAAIQRQKADSALQESERIYRQAIEAADAVPYYLDYATDSYLFMGQGIQSMTGYTAEEMSPDIWLRIVQERVMLGNAAGLTGADAIEAVRHGRIKAWKCDLKIRRRDGQIRWLTDRSIELLDEQNISHGSIGILQDITDRKLTEAGLRKRESILEAITFSAEQFLKTSNWRENIDIVLERLGKEFDATHAYLFEHHPNRRGQFVSSIQYEWTAPGFQSDLENPLFRNTESLEANGDSTDDVLRKGVVFVGNTATYPEVEREKLIQLGIQALVEVPLFVKGEWWGTIGLDDMQLERAWSPAEIDALKIAAEILSAAIQRQEAESAVQESERMYRRAIETAGAVPYYQDYELNSFTFMGIGIREITGYLPNEITPDDWTSMVLDTQFSGELAGLTEAQAIRAAREGKVKAWKCDYHIRARDGQLRWIADSAVELLGEAGESYASIGILQDITERKQVEANLRKGEAILEVVASVANTFLKISEWSTTIWQTEVDKLLERLGTTINASHAYLFENEFSADDQVYMTMRYEWTAPGFLSDLGNPKYVRMSLESDYMQSWNEKLLNGFPCIGDSEHLDPQDMQDLNSRDIKALLDVPIFVDGRWWGTIGFDDQVAPRLWSTTEVDALVVAANLLAAVVKRNRMDSILQNELENRKVLINELESKNEELERFTYTVSHDLKSPLVTISGFLGFLEQDAIAGNLERLKEDRQRIGEAVVKMQRLLNELLELSRVGRMMNLPQTLAFSELVEEAMDIVHGRLEAGGVQVQTQPNLPSIYGDKPRLVEVLQNLIDNAAKYMGDQPVPLIEIGQRGEESGKPVFYIRDNGIGISPEHHERIFGLFNKLDVRSEGTGVGLALVKRIVEVHGGRIWIESQAGRGSTFFFTLPVQLPADYSREALRDSVI